MNPVLPYGRQLIEDDDVAAVVRVLRSDYLTTGPEVEAFEAELAAAGGARFAIAVANGTAALHCAYAAAGVGPGDEVVTTPLTFSATSNMVLALGGRPVFADVCSATLNLDPAKVEAAITDRTRVLTPVDFAGQPAAIDSFMDLAARKNLLIIEDASHSIGARFKGRPVGSLAHMTTFSFHPVKTITTGEGGAVLTDSAELAQKVRDFRNHGLVRETERLTRDAGPWHYEIQSLGFNYRLSALHCALGRSQLMKLSRFVERRRALVDRYRAALSKEPRVAMLAPSADAEPAWHLLALQIKGETGCRASVFNALRRQGIGVQVHYTAVNDFPLYQALGYSAAATPIAQRAAGSLLSLPLFPAMTNDDVDRVVHVLRGSLDELA